MKNYKINTFGVASLLKNMVFRSFDNPAVTRIHNNSPAKKKEQDKNVSLT